MSLRVERIGAGPPLALLHGWGMHAGAWGEAARALAGRFEVHAVDLPGHGGSRLAATTLDAAADAVAQALPDGAAVCGWSLGGLVALRLAMRFPRKAAALVLVASTPCFVRRGQWPAGMARTDFDGFAGGIARAPGETLRRFARLAALGGEASRTVARALDAATREPPARETLAATLGWLAEADLRAAAPRIAPRTLVIHGAEDRVVPVAAGRWLAQALRQARLVELERCAHAPFLSHRAAFVRAVEAFVG